MSGSNTHSGIEKSAFVATPSIDFLMGAFSIRVCCKLAVNIPYFPRAIRMKLHIGVNSIDQNNIKDLRLYFKISPMLCIQVIPSPLKRDQSRLSGPLSVHKCWTRCSELQLYTTMRKKRVVGTHILQVTPSKLILGGLQIFAYRHFGAFWEDGERFAKLPPLRASWSTV